MVRSMNIALSNNRLRYYSYTRAKAAASLTTTVGPYMTVFTTALSHRFVNLDPAIQSEDKSISNDQHPHPALASLQ